MLDVYVLRERVQNYKTIFAEHISQQIIHVRELDNYRVINKVIN